MTRPQLTPYLAVVSLVAVGCMEDSDATSNAAFPVQFLDAAVEESPADSVADSSLETLGLWQHVVTIRAGWNHGSVVRIFPAIVVDCDGDSSWLVSAAWGAEPFPIPKHDAPVESMYLDDTGEDVDIVAFDQGLDVGVFRVQKQLTPWPPELVASELRVGDALNELLPPEHSKEAEVRIEIVAVEQVFEHPAANGDGFPVAHTICVKPSLFGRPGSPLLKDGRMAAIFLNNGGPDLAQHHAIPFEHVRDAYEELRARAEANNDIQQLRELQTLKAESLEPTDELDAELLSLEVAILERLRKVARVSGLCMTVRLMTSS